MKFSCTYLLKVSRFQNEFMKSSFLPKYEPNIVRTSALYYVTLQGRNPYNFWLIFWKKQWHHKFILKFKVHIFWEGHKILRNLQQLFDWQYIGQIIGKILWPSQNIWTLLTFTDTYIPILNSKFKHSK